MGKTEQLEPMGGILLQVRNAIHTPESVGVVLFDYLLSKGASIGTLNVEGDTLEIPMAAIIALEDGKGPQTRCTHICLVVNGVEIACFDHCVL